MNKIRISKNIVGASAILTLLNLAAFYHFGIHHGHLLVAAVTCLATQLFIISALILPNFYFYVLKSELASIEFVSKAIYREAEVRHSQTTNAISESKRSLAADLESSTSKIELSNIRFERSLNDDLADLRSSTDLGLQQHKGFVAHQFQVLTASIEPLVDRFFEDLRGLNKEHRLGFENLSKHQQKTLETLAAKHDEGLASMSDRQAAGFENLAKQQQATLETLAAKHGEGLASVSDRQAAGFENLAKQQQATLETLAAKHDERLASLESQQIAQINNLVNSKAAVLENIDQQIESAIGQLRLIKETLDSSFSDLQTTIGDGHQDLITKVGELQRLEQTKLTSAIESTRKNIHVLGKDLSKRVETAYERIDALLSLHRVLEISKPLPVMHDWRISSDYACAIAKAVLDSPHETIIDIGSGVSTLIFGYAAKARGFGKVFSIEHSKEYFEKTVELVETHGLSDFCEVLLCPLKEFKLNGESWQWYDLSEFQFDKVGVISVDGPPGSTQPLARYPAIPMLKGCINRETIIFLDDANRTDEQMIADRWAQEFTLTAEKVASHKDYFVFRQA